jgi:hypothetical protein
MRWVTALIVVAAGGAALIGAGGGVPPRPTLPPAPIVAAIEQALNHLGHCKMTSSGPACSMPQPQSESSIYTQTESSIYKVESCATRTAHPRTWLCIAKATAGTSQWLVGLRGHSVWVVLKSGRG